MTHRPIRSASLSVLDDSGPRPICCHRGPDCANRIPVLLNVLVSHGQKRKVRLIVGVHAGHQLDIGAIVVGQISIPCISKFVVAPRPLFLARRDVMVRDVHHAGVGRDGRNPRRNPRSVPVDHVAGGHRNVRVPTEVVWRIRTVRHETCLASLPRYAASCALPVVDSVIRPSLSGKAVIARFAWSATKRTSVGKNDWYCSCTRVATFAHHRKVWVYGVRLYRRTLSSSKRCPGAGRRRAFPSFAASDRDRCTRW